MLVVVEGSARHDFPEVRQRSASRQSSGDEPEKSPNLGGPLAATSVFFLMTPSPVDVDARRPGTDPASLVWHDSCVIGASWGCVDQGRWCSASVLPSWFSRYRSPGPD